MCVSITHFRSFNTSDAGQVNKKLGTIREYVFIEIIGLNCYGIVKVKKMAKKEEIGKYDKSY